MNIFGSRMANNIKSYNNFLNNLNINNSHLYPTDKIEIYNVNKNLKPKHSCGHDNISQKAPKRKPTPTS